MRPKRMGLGEGQGMQKHRHWTTLKIAALAPIPRANVRRATAVTPRPLGEGTKGRSARRPRGPSAPNRPDGGAPGRQAVVRKGRSKAAKLVAKQGGSGSSLRAVCRASSSGHARPPLARDSDRRGDLPALPRFPHLGRNRGTGRRDGFGSRALQSGMLGPPRCGAPRSHEHREACDAGLPGWLFPRRGEPVESDVDAALLFPPSGPWMKAPLLQPVEQGDKATPDVEAPRPPRSASR